MGGKKKAPPAPDYKGLAQQQAALSSQNIQQQTVANRPDQITSSGSIKWTQDPSTGKWTQTETLSPELQAIRDKQIAQLSGLQNNPAFQGPQFNQAYADKYSNDMLTALTARMDPQYQRDQESMATKLRLQGLQPGTEAYDRAYKNLLTSQGDVRAQANLQAQLAGGAEARNQFQTEYQAALQNYLLPYQTYAATSGGAGNLVPQYQGFTGSGSAATPDILGAAQQSYAQQMQAYNEAQAKKSSKGSSIGTIVGGVGGFMVGGPAGAAIGASAGGQLGSSFSDAALKYDITPMSDEECYKIMMEMVPVSWRWDGTTVLDAGVIAQQVNELLPELVERGAKGLLRVNYTALFGILLGGFRYLAKKEAENARQ